MKCVLCNSDADYLIKGFSVCWCCVNTHFPERLVPFARMTFEDSVNGKKKEKKEFKKWLDLINKSI